MKYAKLGSLTFLLRANADAGLRGPLKEKEATALAALPDYVLPKFEIRPKFEIPSLEHITTEKLPGLANENGNFNRFNDAVPVPDFRVTPAKILYEIPEQYHKYDSNGGLQGFYGKNYETYHNIRDQHYRVQRRLDGDGIPSPSRRPDSTKPASPNSTINYNLYHDTSPYKDTSLEPELIYDADGNYHGYLDGRRNYHNLAGEHWKDPNGTGDYVQYDPKYQHVEDLRLVNLKNRSYQQHYPTLERYGDRFEKPLDQNLELNQKLEVEVEQAELEQPLKQPLGKNLEQADQTASRLTAKDKAVLGTAALGGVVIYNKLSQKKDEQDTKTKSS